MRESTVSPVAGSGQRPVRHHRSHGDMGRLRPFVIIDVGFRLLQKRTRLALGNVDVRSLLPGQPPRGAARERRRPAGQERRHTDGCEKHALGVGHHLRAAIAKGTNS